MDIQTALYNLQQTIAQRQRNYLTGLGAQREQGLTQYQASNVANGLGRSTLFRNQALQLDSELAPKMAEIYQTGLDSNIKAKQGLQPVLDQIQAYDQAALELNAL